MIGRAAINVSLWRVSPDGKTSTILENNENTVKIMWIMLSLVALTLTSMETNKQTNKQTDTNMDERVKT